MPVIIKKKTIHKDEIIQAVLFTAVLSPFVFMQLFISLSWQVPLFACALMMAALYHHNRLMAAKVFLGLFTGFGALALGFMMYFLLPYEGSSLPQTHPGEGPGQRFDIMIFGPLCALLLLISCLLYFYRFKRTVNNNLERYVSYIFLTALSIAFTVSIMFRHKLLTLLFNEDHI